MGRVALIFLFLGAGCYAVSALFRLQHWPLSGLMRLVALSGLSLGLVLLIIAVVRNRGIAGLFDTTRENEKGGH